MGLYTDLGDGEQETGHLGENKWFWKDKWALKGLDGRYDSFGTMSVRVAPWRGGYDNWVLWEALLLAYKGFQQLKCVSSK